MAHILIFIHWFVLVFTFGNVELVTIDNSKSNDFPIEELNGYTLRQVFEDGNISELDTPYELETADITKIDRIITNGGEVIYLRLQKDNIVSTATSYYIRYNEAGILKTFQLSRNVLNESYKITKDNDSVINIYSRLVAPNTVILTFYAINQSTFDISSLTVEQMDYWFNVYQENEQREISETYDYIENELTTNDLIYIVLFALLWGLAIKIVKGVM